MTANQALAFTAADQFVKGGDMESANNMSKLWIGAKVIGFSGDRNRMDLQIVLTDGTHMRIQGPIGPDPIFNKAVK